MLINVFNCVKQLEVQDSNVSFINKQQVALAQLLHLLLVKVGCEKTKIYPAAQAKSKPSVLSFLSIQHLIIGKDHTDVGQLLLFDH